MASLVVARLDILVGTGKKDRGKVVVCTVLWLAILRIKKQADFLRGFKSLTRTALQLSRSFQATPRCHFLQQP